MNGLDSTEEPRLPIYLWLSAWLCTSLAGGLFGALFFLAQGGGFGGMGAGFATGFYLAAFVGALIVPVIGVLNGIFRVRGRASLRLMTIAGGATGLFSGLVLGPLCVITCVVGAFGARLPGRWHLARSQ